MKEHFIVITIKQKKKIIKKKYKIIKLIMMLKEKQKNSKLMKI